MRKIYFSTVENESGVVTLGVDRAPDWAKEREVSVK
jgi:hypothetical protein